MKLIYKKFNGEDFVLMAKCDKRVFANIKADAFRAKYGKTRVVKTKDGKWSIFCVCP
jgi:hypothetical protein